MTSFESQREDGTTYQNNVGTVMKIVIIDHQVVIK